MEKIECELNQWLVDFTLATFDWVISASANCQEDFTVKDVVMTVSIPFEHEVPMESKALMGGWQFKYDDTWNDYFYTGNSKGIMSKMDFRGAEPGADYIYFLNAEDKLGREKDAKWHKMLEAHACLAYVAPDGVIYFSPADLKRAFRGYAWYYNRYHTELYDKRYDPHWEKKAVLDLTQGKYHKANPPKELFEKKWETKEKRFQ